MLKIMDTSCIYRSSAVAYVNTLCVVLSYLHVFDGCVETFISKSFGP